MGSTALTLLYLAVLTGAQDGYSNLYQSIEDGDPDTVKLPGFIGFIDGGESDHKYANMEYAYGYGEGFIDGGDYDEVDYSHYSDLIMKAKNLSQDEDVDPRLHDYAGEYDEPEPSTKPSVHAASEQPVMGSPDQDQSGMAGGGQGLNNPNSPESDRVVMAPTERPPETTTRGYSNLYEAIENGDLDSVKLLVEGGENPDVRDRYGYSHLHRAAQDGHLEIVKYLHSQGANIENQDNGLTTPLWLAAYKGNLPMVEYLANNGASLDTPRAWFGLFPLNAAVAEGHPDVVKFLIEKGADVDKNCEAFGSDYGARMSSLEIARGKLASAWKKDKPKYEEIIKLLKDAGAKETEQSTVDKLVGDTLKALQGMWIEKYDYISIFPSWDWPNDGRKPECLLKLKGLTRAKEVWRMMLQSLLTVIPLEDPLGPTTIALLMNHCHVDVTEYLSLLEMVGDELLDRKKSLIINIIARRVRVDRKAMQYNRDGARSLMTPQMLDYLFGNLQPGTHPDIMLNSMWTLASFGDNAQPNAHRALVNERFSQFSPATHPVVLIEKKTKDSVDWTEKQLSFSAEWLLDNVWSNEALEKVRSPRVVNGTDINAMIISSDESNRLKIGHSGLEVRCEVARYFQTVMSTVAVDVGSWYYEVTILTDGLMQIGWASQQAKFLKRRAYGVGDDEFGESYDGCRQVLWYKSCQKGLMQPDSSIKWKPGDVVGALIDIENQEVVISVNGAAVTPEPMKELFKQASDEFFAAVSLMSFQHCRFNFGNVPFKFAPKGRSFKPLNEATSPSMWK